MNLPKNFVCIKAFLVLISLSYVSGFSQKDSLNKMFHFSINASAIINRTFSHYPYYESEGRYSSQKFNKVKNAAPYSLGYNIGLTTMLGKSDYVNFIFGLSISYTRSQVNYSESSWSEASGYLGGTQQTTVKDIHSEYTYLNHEVGCKFKVLRHFYLQQSFLFNQNVKARNKEVGTLTTIEYHGYTGPPPDQSYSIEKVKQINEIDNYKEKNYISARITAIYEFKLKNVRCNILAFRNVTLYRDILPWWGFGFSVVL